MKSAFTALLGVLALSSFSYADSENCTGTDFQTGAMISGSCIGDSFNGQDQVTGAFVYGICTGTSFTGTDEVTGSNIYGNCI